jgi:hypothetical protein
MQQTAINAKNVYSQTYCKQQYMLSTTQRAICNSNIKYMLAQIETAPCPWSITWNVEDTGENQKLTARTWSRRRKGHLCGIMLLENLEQSQNNMVSKASTDS